MDGLGVSEGALDCRQPQRRTLPLVLASPHSGRGYPADLIGASRLDPVTLRRSEDSFVDEIFAGGLKLGVPLLAARFPRAYVDVNREPYELDPAMFDEAEAEFGGYLLLDCHSMPSAAAAACGHDAADMVLGDCHGSACDPQFVETARRFLVSRGFSVAINAPYAGGFTTGHYGHP